MYEGTKVQRCPYYGGTFGTFVLSYKNSVSYKYDYYCTVRILFSYEDRHFRKYPRRIVDRYVIPSYESKLYNDVPSYCTTTDFFPELFCTKVFFRVLVEAT